ncbi:hypothetical protein DL767_004253 [Monosporascus sp. MG133]|nr:hypothetical protein DL767_004253 [Monosporascus sp. MG133]
MSTSSKQHIFIVAEAGAGVARSREWLMILHWALPLAKKLLPEHLAAQLKERTPVDPPLAFDAYPNNDVEIKYGHTLKALRVGEDREKATVKLSNGHEAMGTMLIGCDGAKSLVRHYLLGSAKAAIRPLEDLFWNVIANYPGAEQARHIRSAHPIFAMVARPGIFAFLGIYDAPDSEKPEA